MLEDLHLVTDDFPSNLHVLWGFPPPDTFDETVAGSFLEFAKHQ